MKSCDVHVATIYLSDIPVCLKPERITVHTYFVLLQAGFAPVPYHYGTLCALTAHFHPYRFTVKGPRRFFSVALSSVFTYTYPIWVLCYLIRWESGLSSYRIYKRLPEFPRLYVKKIITKIAIILIKFFLMVKSFKGYPRMRVSTGTVCKASVVRHKIRGKCQE